MKLICLLSVLFLLSGLPAGELMLAEKGKSRYQIVLPDHFYDAGVRRCVNAAAKELAKAFKAGAGAEIAVVSEKNAGTAPESISAIRKNCGNWGSMLPASRISRR